MSVVVSQARSDCGVCSVANVLDISWKEAADRIAPFLYKHSYGTRAKDLARGLGFTKFRMCRISKNRGFDDVPSGSIIKVRQHLKPTGNWHWVVWKNGWILDSAYAGPKTLDELNADYRAISWLKQIT